MRRLYCVASPTSPATSAPPGAAVFLYPLITSVFDALPRQLLSDPFDSSGFPGCWAGSLKSIPLRPTVRHPNGFSHSDGFHPIMLCQLDRWLHCLSPPAERAFGPDATPGCRAPLSVWGTTIDQVSGPFSKNGCRMKLCRGLCSKVEASRRLPRALLFVRKAVPMEGWSDFVNRIFPLHLYTHTSNG